jgi:hypothetical protein
MQLVHIARAGWVLSAAFSHGLASGDVERVWVGFSERRSLTVWLMGDVERVAPEAPEKACRGFGEVRVPLGCTRVSAGVRLEILDALRPILKSPILGGEASKIS